MSKRCPHCGSYNTEISIRNYAARAIINSARYSVAVGVSLVASLFTPSAAHAAGHGILHETDPGELNGHHCCNCGKDFSA